MLLLVSFLGVAGSRKGDMGNAGLAQGGIQMRKVLSEVLYVPVVVLEKM